MCLKIDGRFLDNETREGFSIPSKMKRAWATQMDVMQTVGEICDRHGLRWWADYGTLLGAVRHRGYVPWDDDIDISLFREDYNRLLRILPVELPTEYRLLAHAETEEYEEPWMSVHNRWNTDTGESAEEAELTRRYYGNPFRCGIDIMPLDYVPADEGENQIFLKLYEAVYNVARLYAEHERAGKLDGLLADIEELSGQTLPRGESCKSALWDLADRIAQMYTRDESRGVALLGTMIVSTHEKVRPCALYDETVFLPFEFLEVPVPVGYEEVLVAEYGESWRTPKMGTATHDYPFYKSQEQLIQRINGEI